MNKLDAKLEIISEFSQRMKNYGFELLRVRKRRGRATCSMVRRSNTQGMSSAIVALGFI